MTRLAHSARSSCSRVELALVRPQGTQVRCGTHQYVGSNLFVTEAGLGVRRGSIDLNSYLSDGANFQYVRANFRRISTSLKPCLKVHVKVRFGNCASPGKQ